MSDEYAKIKKTNTHGGKPYSKHAHGTRASSGIVKRSELKKFYDETEKTIAEDYPDIHKEELDAEGQVIVPGRPTTPKGTFDAIYKYSTKGNWKTITSDEQRKELVKHTDIDKSHFKAKKSKTTNHKEKEIIATKALAAANKNNDDLSWVSFTVECCEEDCKRNNTTIFLDVDCKARLAFSTPNFKYRRPPICHIIPWVALNHFLTKKVNPALEANCTEHTTEFLSEYCWYTKNLQPGHNACNAAGSEKAKKDKSKCNQQAWEQYQTVHNAFLTKNKSPYTNSELTMYYNPK